MTELNSPTLSLQEPQGPHLEVDLAPSAELLKDSGTPVAVGVLLLIAVLASLVLVPMSRQGAEAEVAQTADAPGWMQALSRLWGSKAEEAPAQAAGEAAPPAAAAATASADPFALPALAPLKGQYCFNYMPYGDKPAAKQAFADLLWDKLDGQVQTVIEDRLDVCQPFAALGEDLIRAGGCRKSDCGNNDAAFFINTQGKVAVEYRIDGVCKQATEEGFTQTEALCR